jgi:hypothetical protein
MLIRVTVFVGVLISAALLAGPAAAQSNPQERAANLRAQLVEVEVRQAELQSRLQQLDEEIKPENIERSLAGIGSVHPEELREARRRQLDIARRGVQSQLETLAASRTRLEAAIATADAQSYRKSVGRGPNISSVTDNITPVRQMATSTHQQKKRRLNKRS